MSNPENIATKLVAGIVLAFFLATVLGGWTWLVGLLLILIGLACVAYLLGALWVCIVFILEEISYD